MYEHYWKPAIAELTAEPDELELAREMMPETDAVAVLCPIYKRYENVESLTESFYANTPRGAAKLYFIDHESRTAVATRQDGPTWLRAQGESCAEKWNAGFEQTSEPWVLCIGDDVRFHEGWFNAARRLSQNFDVIGTNDTAGPVKNRAVANGSHADHFFVRRSYVEEYGACLDGPGVLAPEAYNHWFTDMEIVKLARARGVFSPCLDSVVEHLHPGYDGREDLREADPTYMRAVEFQETDRATWMARLPLIEQQRVGRGRL